MELEIKWFHQRVLGKLYFKKGKANIIGKSSLTTISICKSQISGQTTSVKINYESMCGSERILGLEPVDDINAIHFFFYCQNWDYCEIIF